MARFSWTIRVEIDETWVADGFDLTEDNIKDRVSEMLPHAHGSEYDAKVLKAPQRQRIMKAQGYTEPEIRAAIAKASGGA